MPRSDRVDAAICYSHMRAHTAMLMPLADAMLCFANMFAAPFLSDII